MTRFFCTLLSFLAIAAQVASSARLRTSSSSSQQHQDHHQEADIDVEGIDSNKGAEDNAFWGRYLQNSVESMPVVVPTTSPPTTVPPVPTSAPPVPAPTVPAPTVPAPTVPPTSDPPSSCVTIYDIACSQSDFSTLCSLLNSTGLSEAVDDPTAIFTVFAPTNEAFDAIASVLPTLTEQDVVYVLLYHVTNGEVLAGDLVCDGEVTMVNELPTTTTCTTDGGIFQVGTGNTDPLTSPRIVLTDIRACNGIIHVVDNVILPAVFPDPAALAESVDDDAVEPASPVTAPVAP